MGDPNDKNDPTPWNGWTGTIAHPSAPAGGGGPGGFRTAGVAGLDPSPLPSPNSPQTQLVGSLDAQQVVAADAAPAAAAKAPPTTVLVRKSLVDQHTPLLDVTVVLVVLADTSDSSLEEGTAETDGDVDLTPSIPGYTTDDKGVVTAGTGPFTMTGQINIQTKYGPKTKPTDPSAYGRGTTDADNANGDTTIGFHESCHRADYLDYFNNNAVPLFQGEVGKSAKDWETAKKTFAAAFAKFKADPKKISYQSTDNVGNPTLAQYNAANKRNGKKAR